MFSDVIFCFCAWLKMLDERHSKSNAMLLYRRDCWYPLFQFYTTGTQAVRRLSIINENWIFTGNSMTSLFFWLSVDGTLQSSGYMQMWTANNNNKKCGIECEAIEISGRHACFVPPLGYPSERYKQWRVCVSLLTSVGRARAFQLPQHAFASASLAH